MTGLAVDYESSRSRARMASWNGWTHADSCRRVPVRRLIGLFSSIYYADPDASRIGQKPRAVPSAAVRGHPAERIASDDLFVGAVEAVATAGSSCQVAVDPGPFVADVGSTTAVEGVRSPGQQPSVPATGRSTAEVLPVVYTPHRSMRVTHAAGVLARPLQGMRAPRSLVRRGCAPSTPRPGPSQEASGSPLPCSSYVLQVLVRTARASAPVHGGGPAATGARRRGGKQQ